jgi:hypothetical protein
MDQTARENRPSSTLSDIESLGQPHLRLGNHEPLRLTKTAASVALQMLAKAVQTSGGKAFFKIFQP